LTFPLRDSVDTQLVRTANKLYRNKKWLEQKYTKEVLSLEQIARLSGCTPETIRTWLKRHGIPVRGYAEAVKIRWARGDFDSEEIRQKHSAALKKAWEDEERRQMRTGENHKDWRGGPIRCICKTCGKEFEIKRGDGRKGRGNFCSRSCQGKWRSENMCGENNPTWKEKVEKVCKWCGKGFEVSPSQVAQSFCSVECKGLWQSENMCGENSPNWKGGISFEPYPPEFNDTLRQAIRERDNYTCAISGNPGRCVHHINYDKADNRPENLITLENSCHSKTNTNRKYWESILSPIAIARTYCILRGDG